MSIAIGLVDDHQLFLKSLSLLISGFEGFHVAIEAVNGKDLIEKLQAKQPAIDILLIDVNMPIMNGIGTAKWFADHYPQIKLAALSMNDDDKSIISMLKAGCCAYLLKDTHPNEFEKALHQIQKRGFYNSDASNINYRRLLVSEKENNPNLTEKEKNFLQLACSEMTYKEIAFRMNLSERTIDGYRESVFSKLNVQSRVGMCLEAIRREIVKLGKNKED